MSEEKYILNMLKQARKTYSQLKSEYAPLDVIDFWGSECLKWREKLEKHISIKKIDSQELKSSSSEIPNNLISVSAKIATTQN